MKRISLSRRALVMVAGGAAALSTALVGHMPARVLAAETHSNCVTVDGSGNIVSVVPNCTQTMHVTSPPSVQSSPNPCTGEPGTLTIADDHSTFHVNVNGKGDVWATGTSGGTVSFVPDNASAPSGSGPWTVWFGEQLNNRSTVMGSTFHAIVHLSDGTSVSAHEDMHMTVNANGVVTVVFDRPTLTCGG